MPRVVSYFSPSVAVVAGWLICSLAIGAPAFAQLDSASSIRAVPLIQEPVDETKRSDISGNIRPEIGSEFDRGKVDDAFPMNGMQLLLKRSPAHQQAAEDLAEELHRAGSPQLP